MIAVRSWRRQLRRGDIDAFASQALEAESTELIRAEPPDVRAPSAARSTIDVAICPPGSCVNRSSRCFVLLREAVDDREEVDAVLAKAGDVERSGGGSEKRKRNPHGRPC
jgi:hypothetical protein